MESRSQIEYVRDETNIINTMFGPKGKITSYKYKIYVHNKPSVEGELTLKEMNDIYSQYSIYGANLTQREVSRNFQIPLHIFCNSGSSYYCIFDIILNWNVHVFYYIYFPLSSSLLIHKRKSEFLWISTYIAGHN